jgi:DNA-binding MarR family transcriptional regulator
MSSRTGAPTAGQPAVDAAILLTQAEALLARSLGRALRPYGVSWPQALSLFVLADQPDAISATRLVERLGLGRTAMTSVVDRLQREGWVERQRSSRDRRVAYLVLTDDGRRVVERIRPALSEAIAAQFADVSRDDVLAWHDGLLRLIRVLGAAVPAETAP